mgnify:CR=1 FL=1
MNEIKFQILENYKDNPPPIDFKKVIQILFNYIPVEYQAGLGFVILEDGTGMSRQQRHEVTLSRGKKYLVSECQGVYRHMDNNKPASIVMYVNNILTRMPLWAWKMPFFRDITIADVFYHEFGHHIHKVHSPEYKHREDVADRWSRRLRNRFVYHHYWYLLPILYPLAFIVRICKMLGKRR